MDDLFRTKDHCDWEMGELNGFHESSDSENGLTVSALSTVSAASPHWREDDGCSLDNAFDRSLTASSSSFSVFAKTTRLFDWTEFFLLIAALTFFGVSVGCQSANQSLYTSHSQHTKYQFRAQDTTSPKKKGIFAPVVNFFRKDEDEQLNPAQPLMSPLPQPGIPNVPPFSQTLSQSAILGDRTEPYQVADTPFGFPVPSPSQTNLSNQVTLQNSQPDSQDFAPKGNETTKLHPDLITLITDLNNARDKNAGGIDWEIASQRIAALKAVVTQNTDWYQFMIQQTRSELLGGIATNEQTGQKPHPNKSRKSIVDSRWTAMPESEKKTIANTEPFQSSHSVPSAPTPSITTLASKTGNARLAKLREMSQTETDFPVASPSPLTVPSKSARLAKLPKETAIVPQGHFAPLQDESYSSYSRNDESTAEPVVESSPTRQASYQTTAFVQAPSGALASEDWKIHLHQTIETLKTQINLAPSRELAVQDELRLRLLTLALGNQRESQQPIQELDEHFQAFFSNELFGLATLLDDRTMPDVSVRCIMAQPHFQEAQEQLQYFCPLKMRNIQFIQNDWRGFGGYTPTKGEFQPDDVALVYLEMENVCAGGNAAIGYNTKMSFSYEILDGNGATVAKSNNMLCEEVSRSRRKDISWTIPIELPNTLSPGHYFILIRAVDQNHLRLQMDTQRIGFMITPIRTVSSSK